MGVGQVAICLVLIACLFEGSEAASVNKRPFCNAFTGCGRKRSDPSLNEIVSNAGQDEFNDDWDNAENYAVSHFNIILV